MTDFEQALVAELGMLKAAVTALFLTHPDPTALRAEFQRHAAMVQVSHSMLTSEDAKRGANDLMAALLDSLGDR